MWQRPTGAQLAAVNITAKDRDTAAAAGGGIRFNILEWLNGYLEVAKPLNRDIQAQRAKNEDGKDLRYFFSLATQF